MSRPDLPRDPAFSVLRPDPPTLGPAPEAVAQWLGSVCGVIPERVQQLQIAGQAMPGKFTARLDGAELFLKVVDGAELEIQLLADRIARHAAERHVGVSVLAAGFPKRLLDGRILLGFPWVEHRFAEPTGADLRRIGQLLAGLHAALADFPEGGRIRQLSEARLRYLTSLAGSDLGAIAGVPADALTILARNRFAPEVLLGNAAQPIHGDMNFSNVCFDVATGAPVLIDFETACRSWMAPACDLAQVIDRFVWTAPEETQDGLVAALASGYGTLPPLGDLLAIIGQLALRSLLLLIGRTKEGAQVPSSEWQKFVRSWSQVKSLEAGGA